MAENEPSNPPENGILDLYKIYVQDVGNIGGRHENSRRFYMSIISALFVFLSMTGEGGPLVDVKGAFQEIVGIVGIVMCIVWIMHMQSFAAIYLAKFKVLREIEKGQGFFALFDREWEHLKSDSRYKCLTLIDSVVPIVFASLFVVIVFVK